MVKNTSQKKPKGPINETTNEQKPVVHVGFLNMLKAPAKDAKKKSAKKKQDHIQSHTNPLSRNA